MDIYNMNIKSCLIAALFCFGCSQISAQYNFKAAIVGGFTLSQIDGDGLLGYDKVGISTGLKLNYNLNEKWGANFEMLYSQRGSQAGFLSSGDEIQKTHLDYIELPFYININDWWIEGEDYFKIRAHAGFSYGYMMNISSANGVFEEDIDNFNRSDVSGLVGVSYAINNRWSFTARFTRAFTKLFKSNKLVNTDTLVSYFWTLRSEFNF
jgi:hypothetical protein